MLRASHILALGGLTLGLACGDGPDTGFSAANPSTPSSLSEASTAETQAATTQPTGDTSGTNPGCADLTLCPGTETAGTTTGVDPATSSPPVTSTDPTLTAGTSTTSTTSTTSADTGDSDDPCDGAGDGTYCGATLGGFADHNSLYQCLAGMTTSASPCPAGCENGACKPVQQDPCASAMSGNGAYCGGTLMGGDTG